MALETQKSLLLACRCNLSRALKSSVYKHCFAILKASFCVSIWVEGQMGSTLDSGSEGSLQSASGEESGSVDSHPREKVHLLIVEDEPTIRHLFAALLGAAGYSVAEAENGFEALEEVRRKKPALILSDLNMPHMTGFELLSVVRRRFPTIRIIAMSGAFAGDNVPDGVSADAFYEKSGRHISTLVEVIEKILAHPEGEGVVQIAESPPEPEIEQSTTAKKYASVALWVTRLRRPIHEPHILLTCPECLRSFPHREDDESTMEVHSTPCVYCKATIAYALLDPSSTHHPGYGPAPR